MKLKIHRLKSGLEAAEERVSEHEDNQQKSNLKNREKTIGKKGTASQ